MPEKPACYGTMFPNLDQLEPNEPRSGKVFSATVSGSGFGVSSRRISVDRDQWELCLACPAYRGCYDLSLGRLSLRQALARY